jgi:predicted amidohydrolase
MTLTREEGERSPSFTLAVAELTSVDSVERNVASVMAVLSEVEAANSNRRAENQIKLVCLPENALFLRVREGDAIEPIDCASDARTKPIRDWCSRVSVSVHIGSVAVMGSDRMVNASVLIGPSVGPSYDRRLSQVRQVYEKIHLFDVDVQGLKPIRESDSFDHGSRSSILEIEGWRFASSICYDIRFAELYSIYARQEVDAILIPSAFLVQTGQAHWDVLTRARAIESQAYVIASAQGGEHRSIHSAEVVEGDGSAGARYTYGHSRVVDPWGVVVGEVSRQVHREALGQAAGDGGDVGDSGDQGVCRDPRQLPSWFECTLSRARLEQVRRQIPMRSHRRPLS